MLRIKNLRVSAAEGLPGGIVNATVSAENATGDIQLSTTALDVAFLQPGVEFQVRNAEGTGEINSSATGVALPACQDWNAALASNPAAVYGNTRSFTLRFRESFARSFGIRDVNPPFAEPTESQNFPMYFGGFDPSLLTKTESGFFNTAFPSTNGLNRAGRAPYGTRLLATFQDVPAGAKVYVSAHSLRLAAFGCDAGQCDGSSEAGNTARAYGVVADANGHNAGASTQTAAPTSGAEVWSRAADNPRALPAPFPSSLQAGMVEVPITNGTGTFTWEVIDHSLFSVDTLSFAVAIAYPAGAPATAGPIQISGKLVDNNQTTGPIATANFTGLPCSGGISLSGLTPTSANLGATPPAIVVFGSGFTSQSVVRWKGSDRVTTFVNATMLQAQLTAYDMATPGAVPITVFTPGLGTTAPRTFTVNAVSPAAPHSPTPVDATTEIMGGLTLSWMSSNATSYDLYFGSSAPLRKVATLSAPEAPTGPLASFTTYYWQVVARNAAGSASSPVWRFTTGRTSSTDGYLLTTVQPCRILDTRLGSGAFAANETRNIPILSSPCGITGSAKAYALNITAVPKEPLGYLTAWPQGAPQPLASTLNSFHGSVVANAAVVTAGIGGGISIYTTNPTDVIIDITGYFDQQITGSAYSAYTPCRIADTRSGSGFSGAFGGPSMAPSVARAFPMRTSGCSVPANASALSLNVTALPHAALSYLTMWPGTGPAPLVSTLNSFDGDIVSNAAILPLGATGTVSALTSDAADIVMDANGAFVPPATAGAGRYHPLTPCRILDTRADGNGSPIAAGGKVSAAVSGNCGVPISAKGYVLNVTAVPTGPLAFLTMWPSGDPQPFASTLNSFRGNVVANAALTGAGTGGVDVFVTDPSHVVIDVSGYFQ